MSLWALDKIKMLVKLTTLLYISERIRRVALIMKLLRILSRISDPGRTKNAELVCSTLEVVLSGHSM